MQSKKISKIESMINTFSTSGFNWSVGLVLIIIFKDIAANHPTVFSAISTTVFTIISLVRNYTIRRAFNHYAETGSKSGIHAFGIIAFSLTIIISIIGYSL